MQEIDENNNIHIDAGGSLRGALPLRKLVNGMQPKQVLRLLYNHPKVVISANDFELFPRSFLYKFAAMLLGRGHADIQVADTIRRISLADLVSAFWHAVKDNAVMPAAYLLLRRRLNRLALPAAKPRWCREASPLYLRVEPQPGQGWGGMASHMLGVLGGLAARGPRPLVLSSTLPAEASRLADLEKLQPIQRGWNRPPTYTIWAGLAAEQRAKQLGQLRSIGFIYQRNSPFVVAGLAAARALHVPFVLEYNGSEVWMARHWGGGTLREGLLQAVEETNLRHADLVVTVSAVSAADVIARGARPERVLALPNGVDPSRFTPDCDASGARSLYGLGMKKWIGFSGSFGPWHGAEILAQAFAALMARRPDLREEWGLLLIGEGARREAAMHIAETAGIADLVRATGAVAPEKMPELLAACDILVSPQVANPDGTAFFGSPTKLFEYMAMQRAVIASSLGQMADVISNGANGLLSPPGDADALAAAMERLCADEALRQRLGKAAREAVLRQHTWQHHVDAILGRLAELNG